MTESINAPTVASSQVDSADLPSLLRNILADHWRLLAAVPLLCAALALPASYLIKPTFTARTSFLPPQSQGVPMAAAASLGALANLAGGSSRTPADQYVALMQSITVMDRLIDRFELKGVYDVELKTDARRELQQNVRASLSKREGIIAVEVDDHSAERAARLANAHVEELGKLISTLAITEAQQRRLFFDKLLKETQDKLAAAQSALQASSYSGGTLRAEPKAAAETYAKLRAEITATEAQLQALNQVLTSNAPEIRRLSALQRSLEQELSRTERSSPSTESTDYLSKYRDFKYQETLYEMFARQYETARVDEAKEGGVLQVIDAAGTPEKKSAPKRARIVALTYFGSLAALLILLMIRIRTKRTQAAK